MTALARLTFHGGLKPRAAAARYAALHEEAFAIRQKPWSPATFEAFAADPAVRWIEFWSEAAPPPDLAALSLWRRIVDEGEILTFCRARRHAGRDLGALLLDSVIADARSAGVRSLVLEVAEANHSARRLYAEFDFAPVGFRRSYYRRADGVADNALILRKSI